MLIGPRRGWFSVDRAALWEYRDLFIILAQRDLRVRYKQTILGAGWAVLQPLLTMLVLTLVFGRFAKVSSGQAPYPVFVLAGLLIWNVFSQTLTKVSSCFVSNANLVCKVYFPRLIVPAASGSTPLADFVAASLLLFALMMTTGVVITWKALAFPALALAAVVVAFAFGLWLAVLNVRYRDVGHMVPFMLQFLMFLSPVGYPSSLVPARWRTLYDINPLTWLIDGSRWALLGGPAPPLVPTLLSVAGVVTVLLGGLAYFGASEDTLVDEL